MIGLDRLEEFISSLKSKFKEKSRVIIDFLEKYSEINDLPYSNRYKIYDHHPKIILDYFKEINTKEKAYWLGFIYADACISFFKKNLIRFSIELGKKDEILIDRFANAIGFNLRYKRYRFRGNSKLIVIEFSNRKFVNNLQKCGVMNKKSKVIELPELGNMDLNLAFLLGLYDGDGTEGRTTLTSGSVNFIKQIKEKYHLPYRIRYVKGSNCYRISLGGELFNKMMANYKYSLERKRKQFEVRKQGVYGQFKKKLSKEELQDLIWKAPVSKIAKIYGVWRHQVDKLCKEWNVKKPPLGYWNQKKFLKNRERYLL